MFAATLQSSCNPAPLCPINPWCPLQVGGPNYTRNMGPYEGGASGSAGDGGRGELARLSPRPGPARPLSPGRPGASPDAGGSQVRACLADCQAAMTICNVSNVTHIGCRAQAFLPGPEGGALHSLHCSAVTGAVCREAATQQASALQQQYLVPACPVAQLCCGLKAATSRLLLCLAGVRWSLPCSVWRPECQPQDPGSAAGRPALSSSIKLLHQQHQVLPLLPCAQSLKQAHLSLSSDSLSVSGQP